MTAPGWYPDPSDPSQQRWWDGTSWGPLAAPQPIAQPPTQPGASAWGQNPGPTYGQPVGGVYAPQTPTSAGRKKGRTALIIAAVVIALAGAGAGAWFVFLAPDEVKLDELTDKLEDDNFECEKSREVEKKDLEELFERDDEKVPDEVDVAFDKIDDADADAEFQYCMDPDDSDRGVALLSYDGGDDDIVVLVIQSDDDIVDEDELGDEVGVIVVPPDEEDDSEIGYDDSEIGYDDEGYEDDYDDSSYCATMRRTIQTAIEAYNANEGYYPDSLYDLEYYLDEIPSEDDWYYDYEYGTVEPISGYSFTDDEVADCY